MNGPSTAYETSRLEALAHVEMDSSAAERRFDNITQLAAIACHAPIAFIGFVDAEHVQLKSTVGLSATHFPRSNAFCAHAIATPHDVMIVPDARHDPRFAHNAEVVGDPRLRAYAGMPLLDSKGYPIGVLAVMDFLPRGFSDHERGILRVLAKEIVTLLDLCDRVRRLEGELAEHVRYQRGIEVAQRDLRKTTGLLTVLSTTDDLTHLANRGAFDRRLAHEINRVKRHRYPLSLLMIDIDDFKQYNDTFGHPAGDEALRIVAQLLRRAVRKIDCAARIGGDEFAVVLPFTDLASAAVIAERCRAAAATHRWPHGPLRISVGVAQLSPRAIDGAVLLRAADEALYRAKFGGRNMIAAQSEPTLDAPRPAIAKLPARGRSAVAAA
jgi:diguanylate cyclase (GGDEF)-like protein